MKLRYILLGLALIGALGVFLFSGKHGAQAPVAAAPHQPAKAQTPSPAVATPPAATPAAVPVAAERPEEIRATAQMYAAHASLRTPEVADPDSQANREILQTMVFKALAQPARLPPSVPPQS